MDQEQANNNSEKDVQQVSEDPQSLVDQANIAAERLEAANKRAEELAHITEQQRVKESLAGKSLAGNVQVKEEEESPADYAKRVMGGQI